MTRAEVIAIVERVAAANGWHVVHTAHGYVYVQPRPVEDDFGEPCTGPACVEVFVHDDAPIASGEVWPRITAHSDSDCAQAVADWPEVQRMVATLREALGVQS